MTNIITLPEMTIETDLPIPEEGLLLCGGGRAPAQKWLKGAAKGHEIWCIDHGLDCCYQAGLLPTHLIGDGDSANPLAWHWAENNQVEIAKFPPEKDFTDTQLALDMAKKRNKAVLLTGAFGGRLDHAYSTAFTLAHSGLPALMADEKEALLFLHSGHSMALYLEAPPKAISLLAFTPEAAGVSISNVKWPLEDVVLAQAFPYSVSNEWKKNPVTISIATGILGVYICWNE